MPANVSDIVFDLKGQTEATERGKKFWNNNEVEMKFLWVDKGSQTCQRATKLWHGEHELWTGRGLWQQTGALWSFSGQLSVWNRKADLHQAVTFQGNIAGKPRYFVHSMAHISPHNHIILRLQRRCNIWSKKIKSYFYTFQHGIGRKGVFSGSVWGARCS